MFVDGRFVCNASRPYEPHRRSSWVLAPRGTLCIGHRCALRTRSLVLAVSRARSYRRQTTITKSTSRLTHAEKHDLQLFPTVMPGASSPVLQLILLRREPRLIHRHCLTSARARFDKYKNVFLARAISVLSGGLTARLGGHSEMPGKPSSLGVYAPACTGHAT